MSVLFPQVNKPRQWDYRPRYYDPKKDERQQKLAKLRAEREKNQASGEKSQGEKSQDENLYVPNLHRGSFREARDANNSRYTNEARKGSRLAFWIALVVMLVAFIWALT